MPRGHVLPDRDTIATLRGEAGHDATASGRAAGYGVRTISKIEGGQPTSSSTLAAIAIVLAESLRRPVHLVDLICQPQAASRGMHSPGGAMIVAENIKLLDLAKPAHSSSARIARQFSSRAVLVDTFRLRYLPANLGEIEFYYATSGNVLTRSLAFASRGCSLAAGRSRARAVAIALRAARRTRAAHRLDGSGESEPTARAEPGRIRRRLRAARAATVLRPRRLSDRLFDACCPISRRPALYRVARPLPAVAGRPLAVWRPNSRSIFQPDAWPIGESWHQPPARRTSLAGRNSVAPRAKGTVNRRNATVLARMLQPSLRKVKKPRWRAAGCLPVD